MAEENNIQKFITYGKAVFYKTLIGKIYKYLKKYEEATTEKLINYLIKKTLIRGNGKTYQFDSVSSCRQAVCGTSSSGIFDVTKDNWKLIEGKAKLYKQGKVRKYYNKSLRSDNRLPLYVKEPKLFKKIRFLQKHVNEIKSKKTTEGLLSEPLKELEGGEDIKEAAEKIGKGKLFGMIEGYLITTKYCKFYIVSKIMNKNYQNSSYEIQDRLVKIHERLKNFEKYITHNDGTSNTS